MEKLHSSEHFVVLTNILIFDLKIKTLSHELHLIGFNIYFIRVYINLMYTLLKHIK